MLEINSQPESIAPSAHAAECCPNCGELFAGDYCYRCGEKKFHHHDFAIKHFVLHSLHELTHLDSKILHTLKALVFKPGFLTNEYLAGRRTRYLSPLSLYLVLFALALFAYSNYKPVAIYSTERFIKADKQGMIERHFERLAQKENVPREVLIEQFDERIHKAVERTELANVIGLAFVLQIIYWRAKRYFVEHLIFSLHLLAFFYLIGLLMWPIHAALGRMQQLDSVPGVIIESVYIFAAISAVYPQPLSKRLIKSILLFAAYFLLTFILIGAIITIILIVPIARA